MKIFEARHVSKNFGGIQATSDLSFEVRRGEFLGIIGPNGAGKTTLFNLMTGYFAPTSGELLWKGESLRGLRPDQIARRGIVRTFQITRVFPRLSIRKNLEIAHHLQRTRGRASADALERSIGSLLEFFGFSERSEIAADTLPYGDRKKLSVALALAADPELLLLDEPVAGLNDIETAEMADVLRKIKGRGVTQVLIEHDMKFLMGLCDRVICLNFGRQIAEGTPQEIRNDDEVIKVYLGQEEMC
ncbi:MAG: ABC transporter ATP-binding protein [Burkholderiaceae bacterium]|nr:ABC transporter ATP-binding protein [Burkholderiaceae bacterium]